MIDFSSWASIFVQPQTAGFTTGQPISKSLRPRQTKWVPGVVSFSGLLLEVRKATSAIHSYLLSLCVCVSASETQRPAPFLPLDWPSTFVLLEAAPGSLMKAMFFQGLGARGAESLINVTIVNFHCFILYKELKLPTSTVPGSHSGLDVTTYFVLGKDVHTSQNEQLPPRFLWL